MKKILIWILILMFILLGILLYSRFIGTTGLKTNDITLDLNIPTSYNGLKIIHFSDLHYKKVITKELVINLIKEINRNNPDIVLFTGDLIDKDYDLTNKDINFLIKELSSINTKYGTYAIMGDQDYNNEDTVKNIYLQSNITLLKNSSTYIYNESNEKIVLVGMGSYLKDMNTDEALSKIKEDNTTKRIILVHEPDAIKSILNNDNIILVLGGHSINGSINIPIIREMLLPYGAREYNLDSDIVYISNGIGVNNFNFRLFNKPSINLYRFNVG